jgi:hypothetical protein
VITSLSGKSKKNKGMSEEETKLTDENEAVTSHKEHYIPIDMNATKNVGRM